MAPLKQASVSSAPSSRRVYVISVAAELAGVHPQTLRFYERRGLIHPERTPGGSRRYSDRDLDRLRQIQELKAQGLSLAGVEALLEMQERLDRTSAEVTRLQRALALLESEHRRSIDELHRRLSHDERDPLG